VPHSSAQWPTYAPIWSMVTSNVLVTLPGNTSRLKSSSGTQNEWITSSACSTKRIRLCVGSTSTGMVLLEPMVAIGCPAASLTSGYTNSQFHLNAITSTVTSGLGRTLSTSVCTTAV
jgi:hypothetical protein